jgi:hypothetical protein
MNMNTAALVAQAIRKIAEYSAERELIKEGLIERWPQRSVFLAEQIENHQDAVARWLTTGR